jgi:hypothetical protein
MTKCQVKNGFRLSPYTCKRYPAQTCLAHPLILLRGVDQYLRGMVKFHQIRHHIPQPLQEGLVRAFDDDYIVGHNSDLFDSFLEIA